MVDTKPRHKPFWRYTVQAMAIFLLVLISALRADVIYLKNGKQLRVEKAWEEGDKIRYEKDGNLFGFSKDLVERLTDERNPPDATPETNRQGSSPSSRVLPIEVLEGHLDLGNTDPRISVVRDGKIDYSVLQSLEKAVNQGLQDQVSRQAYQSALYQVIELLVNQGELSSAMSYLQRLLLWEPNNLQAQMALGAIHLRKGQYVQAENILSQAEVQNPGSADLLYLLGSAYYFQEKNKQAKQLWERSLQIKFRPDLETMLKKIEGENKAEDLYRQANSLHFVIKYEGSEVNQALSKAILFCLENAFSELESSLGYSPREPIAVILYPDEVFRDITRTPGWVGAINDGKIRLPIKGLSRLDESLSRILKHELTHSFVRLKTGPDCPVWLNEGLAQFLSGEDSRSHFHLFKQAVTEQKLPALRKLEVPFLGLPLPLVQWAYKESLLAVEFLERSYGMRDIQRLLEQAGNSDVFEPVLMAVLRRNYLQLQEDLEDYVKRH